MKDSIFEACAKTVLRRSCLCIFIQVSNCTIVTQFVLLYDDAFAFLSLSFNRFHTCVDMKSILRMTIIIIM